MDPLTAGILAGSTLLGGLGSWFNASSNRKAQNSANRQNYDAQKEFYQNSVSWRVSDSRRAGVNPLYGLGADSASFTPTFQAVGDNRTGDSLTSVGQSGLAAAQLLAQSDMMKAQTRMYNAEAAFKEKQASELGKNPAVSNTLDPIRPESSTPVSPKKKVLPQNDYGAGFVPGTNRTMVYDFTDDTKDRVVVSPIGSQVREEFFQGISKTPFGQLIDKLQSKFGLRFKNEIVLPSGTYYLSTVDTDPNGIVYIRQVDKSQSKVKYPAQKANKQAVIRDGRIYFE